MAKKQEEKTEQQREAELMAALDKQFGSGSLIKLAGAPERQYQTVSTGSLKLDRALGVGGLPRGRIVEIYGPESSGKTTLTLHAIADAQKQGLRCGFIDAEHALDLKYAESLGVDVGELLISQPDHGEQALEICDQMVSSGLFGVIIVDSVAALTPKAELDGEVGKSHVGLQARMMGQALRKMVASTARTDTLVIFINQLRMKIGVMFGSPETTPGGNALKYYCSVRLDVRRIGGVKSGGSDTFTANRTRVKVKKNKVAPPFTEAEFDIEYGTGISREGEVIELGVESGVIQKSGAWLSYAGDKLAQGRDKAKTRLREEPELMAAIEADLLSQGDANG